MPSVAIHYQCLIETLIMAETSSRFQDGGKTKNTLKEQKLLKERYKIEHVFSKIKKNNHIMIRTDKKIKNYLSFIYISFLDIYLNYMDKNNIKLSFIKN